jgi:signal transduction histidine kinase
MDTVLIREFVDLAPVYPETASLYRVMICFMQKSCEHVVVVNEQRHPIGLLRCQNLISHVWQGVPFFTASALSDREITLRQLFLETNAPLLEPLATLPLHMSLRQFQPHLQKIQHQQYALVDKAGRHEGLLDRLQLLQFLATHPLSPIVESPEQLDPSVTSITLHDLIQLLEQLPLPLMLQTSTGEIITQNLIWRRLVDELQNPVEIRHEAATLLSQMTHPEPHVSAQAQLAIDRQPQTSLPDQFCQVGSDDSSCLCVCLTKDGRQRTLKFVKIPLEATSSHTLLEPLSQPGWLVVAQDITEQQTIQELAAQNADLIQLNHLKDEFLACISHELKTPLTAILGLSSLLKDQSVGQLNHRQSHYAQLIHHSGRRLILIVNDILDLNRIETGQLELMPETVNLHDVCTQAHKQARQLHQLERISAAHISATSAALDPPFNLEIEPGLERIDADAVRLCQMLTNLISYAFKFTAEEEDQLGLKIERWKGWIMFTIWDTRMGLPLDKRHLIFQQFQLPENPNLGLVLTQRLAKLHGGDVTFTSTGGFGGQFMLLLPPGSPPVTLTAAEAGKTSDRDGIARFASLPMENDLQQHLGQLLNSANPQSNLPLQPNSISKLTVLHLWVSDTSAIASDHTPPKFTGSIDLYTLLHPHQCRILEVDDLDQADLLTRVWKPDVLLVDGVLSDPIAYLKRLGRQPFLSDLPLVTLTPEITQAANQVPGLAVFPCLATSIDFKATAAASALIQVLQVAAEMGSASKH